MLICRYAQQEPGRMKKIKCSVTGSLCGHVHLCQLSMKFKQTDAAKECPIAFPKDEPAEPKKKARVKRNVEK